MHKWARYNVSLERTLRFEAMTVERFERHSGIIVPPRIERIERTERIERIERMVGTGAAGKTAFRDCFSSQYPTGLFLPGALYNLSSYLL
jgi:hypothetical protein